MEKKKKFLKEQFATQKENIMEKLGKLRKRSLSGLSRVNIVLDENPYHEYNNPTNICYFDKEISVEFFVERLLKIIFKEENYKFRSAVKGPSYTNYYELAKYSHTLEEIEKDEKIKKKMHDLLLENHVRSVTINKDEDLFELINKFMGERMEDDLPKWKIYLIKGYSKGFCICFRQHHSIGDGASIFQAYVPLFEEHKEYKEEIKKLYSRVNWWFKVKLYLKFILTLPILLMIIFYNVFIKKEPRFGKNRNKKYTERNRQYSIVNSFSFKKIKQVSKKYGVTINDVFFGLVSKSLSEYYQIQKEKSIRIGLAVSVRLNHKMVPSNKFGITYASVPLGKMDWKERLRKIKKSTDLMKKFPTQLAFYYLGYFAKLIPSWFIRYLFFSCVDIQTVQSTNVRGPTKPLTIGKSKCKSMAIIVPLWSSIPMSIGFMSYAEEICSLGICLNPELIEMEKFVQILNTQYKDLISLLN